MIGTDRVIHLIKSYGFPLIANQDGLLVFGCDNPVENSIEIMIALASAGVGFGTGSRVMGYFEPALGEARVVVSGVTDDLLVFGASKDIAVNARSEDAFIHSTFDRTITACGQEVTYAYSSEPGPVDCQKCTDVMLKVMHALESAGKYGIAIVLSVGYDRMRREQQKGT